MEVCPLAASFRCPQDSPRGLSHAFVRALFRTAGGRTGNVHADALD
jgi:hypothetical protein